MADTTTAPKKTTKAKPKAVKTTTTTDKDAVYNRYLLLVDELNRLRRSNDSTHRRIVELENIIDSVRPLTEEEIQSGFPLDDVIDGEVRDGKVYHIGDGVGFTLRVENEVGGRIQGEKKDYME